MSNLITLTAEKVPTNDPVLLSETPEYDLDLGGLHRDVLLRSLDGTVKARIPWHYSNKPDRRNKYVTLNCWRWKIKWKKQG